ncbi:ABC transporter substrate-binding protein [Castellaniella sp.]|uniref:ABC transporter substrate-binding protein n=1 Tax=Castellaniella sp. TaxID=1955812 RepID=UPI003A94A547
MRNLLTKLLIFFALASGSMATVVAAEEAPKITVAVTASTDMTLMIAAVKQGFLKNEGIDARLQLFDSSPAALQGVAAGLADVTNNTEPPQLAARARGAKIVQVMTAYLSGTNNGTVVNRKLIKSNDDFKGKTVAVQRGSGADYNLTRFIEKSGLTSDQITVKYLDAPDQIAALARNDIQAFFSWEPFLTKATQIFPDAVVYSRSQDQGVIFSSNVVLHEDMVKHRKDVAVKITRALVKTADWITKNPRKAAEAINPVIKAPTIDELVDHIKQYKWVGDFKRSVYDDEVNVAEWGNKIGLFSASDPQALVEAIVYPDIIKEVAPERTDF